jgi:hypothetical protein
MKFREGFVTNSSSSSFICQVTGRVESGMDLSLSECGMCTCKNGHTFDDSFLIQPKVAREDNDGYPYEVDIQHCPICQFKEIENEDILKFLMKDQGLTKGAILATIQGRFGTYKDFETHIKGFKLW